jgi:hypothetical protein
LVTITTGIGKPDASPPHLSVHAGHTVYFKVKSKEGKVNKVKAIIFLPKDLSEEPDIEKFKTKIVKVKGNECEKLKLHEKCQLGTYPYAIYSVEDNDFVEVHSSPSMVVENDD